LNDHLLNLKHDLTKSDYSFAHDAKGSFKDRFSLTFKKGAERPDRRTEKEDPLLVYNEGDMFKVKATKKVKMIKIYDILGNTILEAYPKSNDFEVVEPVSRRGDVLLMQIIHEDQTDELKKVYKR